MARVDQYNQSIGKWSLETKRKVKLEILRMVMSKGAGLNQQKVEVKKYHGEAAKINFAFPYYMVFVHKGAGKGYGGVKSGLFTRKVGGKGKTNVNSMGKMGTGRRKAKPWFNPVLENQFPALADIIADYKGDQVIAQIQKILIK